MGPMRGYQRFGIRTRRSRMPWLIVAGSVVTATGLLGPVLAAAPPAYAGSALAGSGFWSTAGIPPLPEALDASAATPGPDGSIWLIGGFDSSGNASTAVYSYRPLASPPNWTPQASLPTGAGGEIAATTSGGTIYVIGGDGVLYAFDSSGARSWVTEATRGPLAVTGEAMAAGPDGTIYAIGGEDSDGPSSAVYAFHPGGAGWTASPSLPYGLVYGASATGSDGTIYVLGGFNSSELIDNEVLALAPGASGWTPAASLPVTLEGLAAVTGADGTIYAIGGNGGGQGVFPASSRAYALRPGAAGWITVSSLIEGRDFPAAAFGSDGRIYAIGGKDSNGNKFDTVEAYTPAVADAAQTTSMTVEAGTLSISIAQPSVPFGTLHPGGSSGAISTGDIDYTDTLGDGSGWSATVAASDLTGSVGSVPYTDLTYSPGSTVSGANGGDPAAQVNTAPFGGTDPTPGTSFANPITLIIGTSAALGDFIQSGSTITAQLPSDASPGDFIGTLQYTIVG